MKKKTSVETAELLPPDNKALAPSFSPDAVTAQYRRAIAGTLEMLRFGAMLAEVDYDLRKDSVTNRYHEGNGGLQAWLEEYCPEVNYKTAMRFKRLAEGLQREFKIPAKMRLTDALPAADGSAPETTKMFDSKRDKVIEIQGQIWEFVQGKSARQLLFDFGMAERKPTGGDHRTGLKMTEMEKAAKAREDAKHLWLKDTDSLMTYCKTWKTHLLLDADVLDNVLLRLDTIRQFVREAQGKRK